MSLPLLLIALVGLSSSLQIACSGDPGSGDSVSTEDALGGPGYSGYGYGY